ncbi:NAD-dependent epimerase/dehydratase family protein [Kitasatospora viridis]|uniref:Nucleoside-diphosphate-sugar epimerase n=1 Tax=Kitasatospora viridis TaxID=281105 RepID=A0A561SDJ7_9ACTN|nr:NAD-dependent epimerase/dehydratase family protein [Kitasatospora viridis]TWF72905.1 nucleoside-diphosphate-sugar epimerase [Kitasatospora viridis]
MKVLVLGGTRFIGRAVVDALVDDHRVTVLNRGTRPPADPRVAQLRADRNEPAQVAAALRGSGGGFEAVVDVSGLEAGQVRGVLDALPPGAAPRYVFVSSAAVYRRPPGAGPAREDEPAPGDPVWGEYGTDKAACERLLAERCAGPLTVLRPPYVYGPRNTEQREQFLWARMLAGRPVFVPGAGESRVQFCHAEDLARTVRAACTGELAAGTYNVGEGRDHSFLEYLDLLATVAGVTPDLVPAPDQQVPAREYFPFRRLDLTLDTARLTAAGHPVERELAAGLAGTLDWFRAHGGLDDRPTPRELSWRAAPVRQAPSGAAVQLASRRTASAVGEPGSTL